MVKARALIRMVQRSFSPCSVFHIFPTERAVSAARGANGTWILSRSKSRRLSAMAVSTGSGPCIWSSPASCSRPEQSRCHQPESAAKRSALNQINCRSVARYYYLDMRWEWLVTKRVETDSDRLIVRASVYAYKRACLHACQRAWQGEESTAKALGSALRAAAASSPLLSSYR